MVLRLSLEISHTTLTRPDGELPKTFLFKLSTMNAGPGKISYATDNLGTLTQDLNLTQVPVALVLGSFH